MICQDPSLPVRNAHFITEYFLKSSLTYRSPERLLHSSARTTLVAVPSNPSLEVSYKRGLWGRNVPQTVSFRRMPGKGNREPKMSVGHFWNRLKQVFNSNHTETLATQSPWQMTPFCSQLRLEQTVQYAVSTDALLLEKMSIIRIEQLLEKPEWRRTALYAARDLARDAAAGPS